MREFFHGWRRKAGCFTLVMACALLAVWARSYVIEEEFWIAQNEGSGPQFDFILVSHAGFSWWSWHSQVRNPIGPSTWMSFPINSRKAVDIYHSRKRSLSYFQKQGTVREWHSPLWPFALLAILSLTILSAYLILWKPRKRAEFSVTR